jgi:hypothetical protein
MPPETLTMSWCPGCGVELPGSAQPWDPRSLASEACHQLYGEVAGYESQHLLELGRWHQLLVDTYAAQHATERSPRIGVGFALIGLHLALDLGWSGLDVRDAHQRLANAYRDWPPFEAPGTRGALTVVDLALASSPADHVERLHAWAASVWDAWRPSHGAVRELVSARLDASSRSIQRDP